jgi:starch phosphorylase
MFHDMWPSTPGDEIPITSVTNGVHVPSWVNGDLASLYDQYLQPDWQERQSDPRTWDGIEEIPDAELWEVHRRRKRRLVQFVRESARKAAIRRNASASEVRQAGEVLDFDALTIGFSRRFATYKRATLVFRDIARLKKILNHPERPVQIVVAGKAHPKDEPGKRYIREVWNHSRETELSRRLVFVEDYSIQVARELIQGVDIWLNTPKRPEEACGTSGMKAGVNGVLNLSILDGWFDEAYEISGGWRIGEREPYSADEDDLHASNIYSLLENDIVPMYYEGRERGVPLEWMRRVRMSLAQLSPKFNSGRMVGEYQELLYRPAHEAWEGVSANSYAKAREMVAWMDRVRSAWDRVRFVETPKPDRMVGGGTQVALRVVMDLAGLMPEDVRVEILFGGVTAEGTLENLEVVALAPSPGSSTFHIFEATYAPKQTGRAGMSVRVRPNHSHNPLTRPCESLMKWA